MNELDLMKKYTAIMENRQYSNDDVTGMDLQTASNVLEELHEAYGAFNDAVSLLEHCINSHFPTTRGNLKAYLLDQIKVAVGGHGFMTMNPTLETLIENVDDHISSGGRNPDDEREEGEY